MPVTIRHAGPGDEPAVVALIQELAVGHATTPRPIDEHYVRHFLGVAGRATCSSPSTTGAPVGLLSYAIVPGPLPRRRLRRSSRRWSSPRGAAARASAASSLMAAVRTLRGGRLRRDLDQRRRRQRGRAEALPRRRPHGGVGLLEKHFETLRRCLARPRACVRRRRRDGPFLLADAARGGAAGARPAARRAVRDRGPARHPRRSPTTSVGWGRAGDAGDDRRRRRRTRSAPAGTACFTPSHPGYGFVEARTSRARPRRAAPTSGGAGSARVSWRRRSTMAREQGHRAAQPERRGSQRGRAPPVRASGLRRPSGARAMR